MRLERWVEEAVTAEQCPERPETLIGQPIGQYHCPDCGCMVVAGVPHLPHDDGCWLGLDS